MRALAVLPVVVVLGAVACSPAGRREVLLVARGMTFTLAAEPETPNPVIHLRSGDRVELTLRNEAPGLMHDFRIPAWRVQSEQIRVGDSTIVRFTVPDEAGRYEYICGPHASLMRGVIEVAAP